MNKPLIGLIGSAVLTLSGVYLRLHAHAIAWQDVKMWSGPGSETSWGRQEIALGEIAVALLFAGILLLVTTYAHWLFKNEPEK